MKTKTKIIAVALALAMVVTGTVLVLVNRSDNEETNYSSILGASSMDTFLGLLEKGISAGTSAGVKDAIQPLVMAIGTELFGLPESANLNEIKAQLDEIESKLDDIRKEVAAGIEKIIAEIDKNNKMQTAIDSLARAEYLADQILNANIDGNTSNIEQLSGAEQQRLVEINASIINKKNVDELIDVLGVAKEYLTNGYIDTNYENAFKIYYDYMKRQSMFCGEAADLSEAYWQVMVESYAKSSVALLFALEQQLAMHELADSEPENGIKQEAIDAAEVADEFGTVNVIEKRISDLKANAVAVVDCYKKFVDNAEAESTVFINKGTCYIRLNPQLGTVDLNDLKDHGTYVAAKDFESDGITEELYKQGLDRYNDYFYNNSYNYIDLSSVSFENFKKNQGECDLYSVYSDIYGPYDELSVEDWGTKSKNIFTNVMLNLKAIRYNSANKLGYDSLLTIIQHIEANHTTKTIADYFVSVGFSFGDNDISKEDILYILTGDLNPGNRIDRVESDGRMYDVATLHKKYVSFEEAVDTEDPSGKLVYFENTDRSVRVTIESDGMDYRIDKGVYTITAKELVGHKSDGTPEYTYYEKVYEVEGTKTVYIDLPTDIDFSTISINLGYEGLAASDNHKSLCSYDFCNYVGDGAEITLKMKGYTKWWGGYGVNAEILCDGTSLDKGVG